MASFNKVILLGNLTRDPELRTLPSGSQVAMFSMAMNRKFKTQQGELKEEACFVDVEIFGKQAETCGKYVHRGDMLLVEGRLKQDTWEKDGQKRSKLKVIGVSIQLMPKSAGKGQASGDEIQDGDSEPYQTDAPSGKEEIPF